MSEQTSQSSRADAGPAERGLGAGSEALGSYAWGQSGSALGKFFVQGGRLSLKLNAQMQYAHVMSKEFVRPSMWRRSGRRAKRAAFAALIRRCRKVARENPNAWRQVQLGQLAPNTAVTGLRQEMPR